MLPDHSHVCEGTTWSPPPVGACAMDGVKRERDYMFNSAHICLLHSGVLGQSLVLNLLKLYPAFCQQGAEKKMNNLTTGPQN